MRKTDAIRVIYQASRIYDEQICNKKLLFIYNALNKPDLTETIAYPSNFLHLTGVKLNNNSPETFYIKACSRKLSESDFEFKDGTTEQKLNVLTQVLRISSNAKMIGDFNNSRLMLQTDKLAGGVNACLGFVKVDDYYVPNTVLETDIRQESTNVQKVLAVLSKHITEEKYGKIEMVGKKIDIFRLISKISPSVKIKPEILSGEKEHNAGQT